MDSTQIGQCPYCQSQLESGSLGYASGLFWSSQQLKWWQSIFFIALAYGRFAVGSLASTPWFRSHAGHRCVGCEALVIPQTDS
jgi:hypothetical protein